jgi:hypothetical protein
MSKENYLNRGISNKEGRRSKEGASQLIRRTSQLLYRKGTQFSPPLEGDKFRLRRQAAQLELYGKGILCIKPRILL